MQKIKCICSFLVFLFGFAVTSNAAIESSVAKEFMNLGTPIDTVTSADGKYFYILTSGGTVEVFTASGALEGSLKVSDKADLIGVNQNGSILYLTDKESQTTQLVSIDIITPINVENSPYKGAKDAPVVIALFSDFQ